MCCAISLQLKYTLSAAFLMQRIFPDRFWIRAQEPGRPKICQKSLRDTTIANAWSLIAGSVEAGSTCAKEM